AAVAGVIDSALGERRRSLAAALQAARRGVSLDEAAERAGVGAGWYRALEEGRNVGLSTASLGWVADGLRLAPPPRPHPFHRAPAARPSLPARAGRGPAPRPLPSAEPVPPILRAILDALAPMPAYLVGRRADVLAWNEGAEAIYRCHLIPQTRRNSYLFMFAEPEIRKLIVNWDEVALRHVVELRAAIARAPDDVLLADVRRHLEATSPDFRAIWRSRQRPTGARVSVFSHPRVGRLVFEIHTLVLDDDRSLTVRVYAPCADDGTAARTEKLVRLHRRDERRREWRDARAAVRKAKEHLEASYAREGLLDELAALVGMTKYLLLRTFPLRTGV